MDTIFVLHHKPLTHRKAHMENSLKNLGINCFWVEGYGPSEIPDIPIIDGRPAFYNQAEHSLFLKHKFCLDTQIKNNLERILILEDDALIDSTYAGLNFVEFYERCVAEFKNLNADIMFLGTCCGIEPGGVRPDKFVYADPSYRSRCTHCYTTTLDCAKKSIKYTETNPIASDWFWNNVISSENLLSCYTSPSIFQASERGIWGTSIKC